jgi:hypothetical protein
MIPFVHFGDQMSPSRKAFLIWLAIMILLVIALTIVGLTCETCQRTDLGWLYRTLPALQYPQRQLP